MKSQQDLKNVHQDDAPAVARGYVLADAKLPAIKRGSAIAPDITQSWFEGIEQQAGETFASDRVLQRAKFSHKGLVDSISALERLRDNRSPEITPASHLQRIEKAGKQLLETTDKQFTSIRQEIGQRRNEIKSQITQRLGLDTANPQTNEIRAILRNMTDKQRVAALADAVETGDTVVLSAIWNSHPLSTGIDAKLLESYKTRATRRHCSDLINFSDALNKAEDLLLESYFQTTELTKQAAGSPDALRQFREQAEASDLAAAGFANLLNGNGQ